MQPVPGSQDSATEMSSDGCVDPVFVNRAKGLGEALLFSCYANRQYAKPTLLEITVVLPPETWISKQPEGTDTLTSFTWVPQQ